MRTAVTCILVAVFSFIFGCCVSRCNNGAATPATVVRDTVVLRNTEEKTVVRNVYHTDTAVFVLRDTIKDTIFVRVPIEEKRYTDTIRTDSATICVGVDYHGWRSGIDSVRVDYEIKPLVVRQVERRGFGQFVGIGAGVGVGVGTYKNELIAMPTVGVHIVYGFCYHF